MEQMTLQLDDFDPASGLSRDEWGICARWSRRTDMEQMTLQLDDFDPASGLSRDEWGICARWSLEHPEACNYIIRETQLINRSEDRPVSMRLDIEPALKKHARQWGLDKGLYSGIDHRLTAPLARYLMATRPHMELRFRLRARVGDNVKNATPECVR